MSNNIVKILLSVVLIGGSLTYMLSTSLSQQIEFYYPVDKVITKGDELVGERFRMGGYAQDVNQKPGTTQYWFRVRPIPRELTYPDLAQRTVAVRYDGVVPDTFKEGNEVIVTGTLGSDGTFVAHNLLAKCPSKYEAEEKNKGEY